MSTGSPIPYVSGILDTIRSIEDSTSMSLFQYTKRCTIMSRVYIEKTLAGEEVMTPLMMNIMNIYVGLILTALNMNRYVQGSKKVRDAMQVVATEAYAQAPANLQKKLADYFLGSQSNLLLSRKAITELSQNSSVGLEALSTLSAADSDDYNLDGIVDDIVNDYKASDSYKKGGYKGGDNYRTGSYQGGKVIQTEPKEATLPSGRVISVDFGAKTADGKDSKFKVDMFLQLLPQFIPTEVARQFVEMNFTPTLKQRWLQVSAGEISFFKDFLLGMDQQDKRFKALKKDKSGALRDMITRQEDNQLSARMKLAQITPDKQNIANTILIFEKNSFDKACSTAGLRFKDHNSRQKFFNKTFSMMVCTVDPMYNKIEMFYHGLPAMSQFTFDQVKKNSKTEAVDMMTLMKTFANGMAPKF